MDKLTVLEYANIKGVSKQAVQQQISKGKLKAEKINGQWFINEVPSVVTNPSTNHPVPPDSVDSVDSVVSVHSVDSVDSVDSIDSV